MRRFARLPVLAVFVSVTMLATMSPAVAA